MHEALALSAIQVVCANQVGDLRLGCVAYATHRRLARAVACVAAWPSATGVVAPCLAFLSARASQALQDADLDFLSERLAAGGTEFVANGAKRLTAAALGRAGPAGWLSLSLASCRVDLTPVAPKLGRLQRLRLQPATIEAEVTVAAALRALPSSLRELDVSRVPRKLDARLPPLLDAIAQAHPLLEALDVSGWPDEPMALERLGFRCRGLRHLGVGAAGRRSVLALGRDEVFPSLQSLDVCVQGSELLPACLDAWMAKLAHLAVFRRDGPGPANRGLGTRSISRRHPDVFITAGRGLRSLHLGASFRLGGLTGTSNLLKLVLDGCGARRDLGGRFALIPHPLVEAAPLLASLRHLGAAATGLRDSDLASLLAGLPNVGRLLHLDVSGNEDLEALAVEAAVGLYCTGLVVLRAEYLGKAGAKARVKSVEFVNGSRRPRRPGGCLATRFGARFRRADAYNCATCLFAGSRVVCHHCATTCHAGHRLSYCGRIDMYCDCATLTDDARCRNDDHGARRCCRRDF